MRQAYRFCVKFLLLCWCAVALGTEPDVWVDPISNLPFVNLAGGCFDMGTQAVLEAPADTMWGEVGYVGNLAADEQPNHKVCVDRFLIGRYEVRIGDWHRVMEQDAPGIAGAPADTPVTHVTWQQAVEFANRMTKKSNGKYRFRLPTEAEWEFACLAGVPQRTFAPEELALHARFGLGSGEMRRSLVVVGAVQQLAPNPFGLYDMLGNVWEWVQDGYQADAYTKHSLHNPVVNGSDDPAGQRVIRGGSFRTEFAQVRCARRGHQPGDERLDTLGFRLVREH